MKLRVSDEQAKELAKRRNGIVPRIYANPDKSMCAMIWIANHLPDLLADRETLLAEVERLRDALEEYGAHNCKCGIFDRVPTDQCTCGLWKALESGNAN